MENNRNHETSSGKDENVRYVLSADELQGIIRRALDEGGDRGGRRDRTENGDRSGADDRADRNGTAGTQSRWQSSFTGEGEYVIDLKMAMTALAKRWWIILLATLVAAVPCYHKAVCHQQHDRRQRDGHFHVGYRGGANTYPDLQRDTSDARFSRQEQRRRH